jgi:glycosyltransferase involved in cell wall biosynthesis
LKIVLENVVHSQRTKRGIGTYLQNLATSLAVQDPSNQYVLFNYFFRDFEVRKNEILTIDAPNFTNCVRRAPQSAVEFLEWERGVPVVDRLLPRDVQVYHAIESRLPRLNSRIKTVVTVHDLFAELFPQWFTGKAETLQRLQRDACRRADRIIVISQNTRKDVQRLYAIADDRIDVIVYGMDHATFYPIENPERLRDARARYGLPERFLLSTGPFEPRRNTERLLEVFAALSADAAAKDLFLVLTGGANAYAEVLRRKIAELGIEKKVILPGHVPQSDLAALYRLAEIFVYPSLYEGFGLTPLEALACGAAVIASNASSIPEVVGEAAVLIDPTNAHEMKAAILRLLNDPRARTDLGARGPAQAKKFTWDAAAARTRDVYRTLSP